MYYKGQDVETMRGMAESLLPFLEPFPTLIHEFINALLLRFPGQTALAQAVDLLLHDHFARAAGLPLHQYLGIPNTKPLLSSFTIGLDEPRAVMEKVRRAEAYPILKIKLGGVNDLQLLRDIHAVSGKPVYVDANEGWTVEETLRLLPECHRLNVQLVEQPLPRDDRQGYERLQRWNDFPIPILLDESIHAPQDLARWAGIVQGVNIKLAKVGGIARAMEAIQEARRLDMKVMLGCMIESSLAVTAAAHLAPLADYLDLDGAELLADDPCDGVAFNHGRLQLPTRPGIGAIWKHNTPSAASLTESRD